MLPRKQHGTNVKQQTTPYPPPPPPPQDSLNENISIRACVAFVTLTVNIINGYVAFTKVLWMLYNVSNYQIK